MMKERVVTTTRRGMFEMLVAGTGLAALGLPDCASAQSRNDVLVIGMDISDTVTYDPAVQATGPFTPVPIRMSYETLVTLRPGDLVTLKPQIATEWKRTPDGKNWRFTLRQGVKFSTGNTMTVEDVKWSFDRVLNLKAQPVVYVPNLVSAEIVDEHHIDLIIKDPRRPIIPEMAYAAFVIYERKVLEQNGGDGSLDAKNKDKASPWLDQQSCGTGPYRQVRWDRGTWVQLERNPHYWRGMPVFQRVVIRHISDSAAQLLAIERGDIDMAFNLIPEQIARLKTSRNARVQTLHDLDTVYVALTHKPELNKALTVREARQAIAWAIDYDGIREKLLSGAAQQPASVLPVGLLGSTPEVARQYGYHEDLQKAKALLVKAGYPDGFSFRMSYGNAAIGALTYGVIAQKIQADLGRIGIKMELDPQDPVTLRTQYNAGHSTAVIQTWGPIAIDNWVWASATTLRLAVRMGWNPPEDIVKLVDDGNTAPDQETERKIWIQYQKRMAEEAWIWCLYQMDYQIGVNNRLKHFEMNAAGWYFDIDDIKLA